MTITTFPLRQRTALQDLIAKVFRAPFAKTFSAPLGGAAAVAAVPWFLSGGIAVVNCIGAYQAKGSASLAASYTNLAKPGTYDITPGDAPGWDATKGWYGIIDNGWTLKYLKTGIIPSNDKTWSAFVRFSDELYVGRAVFGSVGVSAQFGISPKSGNYYSGGNYVGTSTETGVMGFSGNIPYINGVAEAGTITDYGTTLPEIYILCNNNNGSPVSYCYGNVQAIALYDTAISAPQAAALSTAIAAL